VVLVLVFAIGSLCFGYYYLYFPGIGIGMDNGFGIGFAIGIGFEFRSIYHGPKSPTLFMNIGQDYCACAFHNRPCSRT
jgi:hypothetical protein